MRPLVMCLQVVGQRVQQLQHQLRRLDKPAGPQVQQPVGDAEARCSPPRAHKISVEPTRRDPAFARAATTPVSERSSAACSTASSTGRDMSLEVRAGIS